MRDNYWKTIDVAYLEEFVKRTKETRFFGLEPEGFRKP